MLNQMNTMMKGWRLLLALAIVSVAPAAFGAADEVDTQGKPRLLSAFFGLDNSLPLGANRLCLGASGKDGMPVVLSRTVDSDSLQPDDFSVVTHSGAQSSPLCATLRPATDAGEGRTVLLIGEFGDAATDPPVSVSIVGDLFSEEMTGARVNFRGARVRVTPLDVGPTLVWAEIVPHEIWSQHGRGSSCPADTEQVVRATWAGGVKLPNGDEPGDQERVLYRVTVTRPDGTREQITPAALADLGDNDNNHLLCLDTMSPAVEVSFPAGHLVDPNADLNADSRVPVVGIARSPAAETVNAG